MTKKDTNILYEAQAILSRRDNSEAEVRAKLAKKGFNREDIEETIVWLKSKKYLNNEKFARLYAEAALRHKAVGPKWIAMKLREKKIASEVIARVVADVFAGQEQDLAAQAAAKWKRLHPKKADDRNRLTRFLLSRGFSGSVAQNAVRNAV